MASVAKREHGSIDMTQGSPMRLILTFSLPLLLGNAFQQLYNMVDSMVVGKFVSDAALAAVGTAFPLIFLLSSLFIGLGMGGTVMIAQFIGAEDRNSVRETVNTIYSALLVIIVPLTIFGVLIAEPLLRLIQVNEEVFPMAHTYAVVVFAGVIGSFGYNVNTGIMQGLGDSKTPLLFLAIACVINIVLDLLFVLVFGLGVFGVALATIIAQFCSWIFGIFYINKKYSFIHISFFRYRLDKGLLSRLVRLGIPSGIQQCQLAVAVLMIQSLVNSFGTDFMAGFSAANKIDTFAFMPIQSFGTAAVTYVGQNLGAGKLDRVQHGVRRVMVLSIITCAIISAIVVPAGPLLLRMFTNKSAVIEAGMAYLYAVLGPMFILAATFTVNSALQGAGATVVSMLSSIVSLWAIRIPVAYLLAPLGRNMIYWSYPIGWLLGLLISGTVYLRGRWKNRYQNLQVSE